MAQTESAPVIYGPSGIGGWLLLPLLHLLTFIGINAFDLVRMFSDGKTGPDLMAGLSTFSRGLVNGSVTTGQWIGVFIVLTTTWILFYPLLCLIQFLRRKSGVPGLMIGFYAILLTVQAVSLALVHFFPNTAGEMGGLDETIKNFIRAAVGAAIWIPYFVSSERVGNTFVR